MNKLITDFTLKSSIAHIIGRNIDVSSVDRDKVISSLWHWVSAPQERHLTADTDELLDLLRDKFGAGEVVETGTVSNGEMDFQTYSIALSNVRFHIAKLPQSYILSAAAPITRPIYQSCRPPKQIIGYMIAFNDNESNGFGHRKICYEPFAPRLKCPRG